MHAFASRLRIAALLLRLGFAYQISSHPAGHASILFCFLFLLCISRLE